MNNVEPRKVFVVSASVEGIVNGGIKKAIIPIIQNELGSISLQTRIQELSKLKIDFDHISQDKVRVIKKACCVKYGVPSFLIQGPIINPIVVNFKDFDLEINVVRNLMKLDVELGKSHTEHKHARRVATELNIFGYEAAKEEKVFEVKIKPENLGGFTKRQIGEIGDSFAIKFGIPAGILADTNRVVARLKNFDLELIFPNLAETEQLEPVQLDSNKEPKKLGRKARGTYKEDSFVESQKKARKKGSSSAKKKKDDKKKLSSIDGEKEISEKKATTPPIRRGKLPNTGFSLDSIAEE